MNKKDCDKYTVKSYPASTAKTKAEKNKQDIMLKRSMRVIK